MSIESHPLRSRIVAEMHLRRMPALLPPVVMVQTVRIVSPDEREAERAHLAVMPDVAEGARRLFARCADGRSPAGIDYIWERHSEASTTTIIAPGRGDEPFAAVPEMARAVAWLESAPGGALRATQVAVVADDETAEVMIAALGFSMPDLVSCRIGTARIWSDFQLHADGYGRLLVSAGAVAPADLGRLVQRVQELGNYRNLALLGLPLAQAEAEQLARSEEGLARIAGQMADGTADATLLDELCALSANVTGITTATGFRMSATAAYAQIAQERLASLACRDIPGFQSLGQFTDRRLLPAVRTCTSFVARLETLSVRIERATALLRTRVEIEMQAQNVALLRSMDANAARQLRLQHLVEGLSVVAISYYAVSLVDKLLPLATPFAALSEAELAAWSVVPVIVAVALFTRWRMRHVAGE